MTANNPTQAEQLETARRQVQELTEERDRSSEQEKQLQAQLQAQAEQLETARQQAQELTEEGGGGVIEDLLPLSSEGFFASPVREFGPARRTVGEEFIRALLAIIFAVAFAGAVGVSYLQLQSWSDTKEWLQIVLPATTALLGAAIGFYFGTRGNT